MLELMPGVYCEMTLPSEDRMRELGVRVLLSVTEQSSCSPKVKRVRVGEGELLDAVIKLYSSMHVCMVVYPQPMRLARALVGYAAPADVEHLLVANFG
jgi:hypothetical protein